MVSREETGLRRVVLSFAARGGVQGRRGYPGGGACGAGHRDRGRSVAVRVHPPPPAPGVPVTRQR